MKYLETDRRRTGRASPTRFGSAEPVAKDRLARQFGAVAHRYDLVTPVQRAMGRQLLDSVVRQQAGAPVRRILEVGCGAGALTRQLRALFPEAAFTAIDFSKGMIDEARRNAPGVRFICCDGETYADRTAAPFDLIVSNATVQWFSDPAGALRRYRALLSDAGMLALATFGDRTFSELNESFEAAYRELGRAPQRHVMPMRPFSYWQSIFADATCTETLYPVRYPDVRSFLRAVQRAGASYTSAAERPLSRAVLERMTMLYQRRFPADDGTGIRVTYHGIQLLVRSERRSLRE